MDKNKCFVSRWFFSRDEISKIKICHMVAKEYPEVIKGRQKLIAVDVPNSEDVDEDASIDHFNEEDGGGLVGAGVIEEVGDM